jgi:hypothetical protein
MACGAYLHEKSAGFTATTSGASAGKPLTE